MRRRIKILFGLEATLGGSLKHLCYLVNHLDTTLFDITVVLSNGRDEKSLAQVEALFNNDITVIEMKMQRSISPWRDFRCVVKIAHLIKRYKFDVVHAHSSKAGAIFRIAAAVRRTPLILYTPHCFYFQSAIGLKKWVFIQVEKALAFLTHKIVVSSGEKKAALNANICPSNKLLTINNAIKFVESSKKDKIRNWKDHLDLNSNFVVGSIGRLTEQKGWETLILAAREVIKIRPDVVFIIAGGGEDYDKLTYLITSLDLKRNVKLLGHIEEIHEIYAIMDVFISSALWEGLPYVIIEAMHHQKPVIATDTGLDEVVINNKTGFIVPKKSHKELSQQLLSLINQGEKIHSMGRAGKLHISSERYSFKRFIDEHINLYRSESAGIPIN